MKLLKMNEFLRNVKSLVNKSSDILGVLGNESVDLDSAGNIFKFKKYLSP